MIGVGTCLNTGYSGLGIGGSKILQEVVKWRLVFSGKSPLTSNRRLTNIDQDSIAAAGLDD